MEFLQTYWLDILTTILGLIYIWLEYRASIALWVVGIIMPALDIYLYWSHGLYGDAGMACYYTVAALYGLCVWRFSKTRRTREPLSIIHMPLSRLWGCGRWRASILSSGGSGLWLMLCAVSSMCRREYPSRQVFMASMWSLP